MVKIQFDNTKNVMKLGANVMNDKKFSAIECR